MTNYIKVIALETTSQFTKGNIYMLVRMGDNNTCIKDNNGGNLVVDENIDNVFNDFIVSAMFKRLYSKKDRRKANALSGV
jgi:hypothetical protein